MPRCSHLPSLPVSPLRGLRESPDRWLDEIDRLDGRDLDASLAVAADIIAAGAWRSWMVRRFIRLHRHEVTRLMRRLGPMIPPSRGRRFQGR